MHVSAYCVQNRNCCHDVGLGHAPRSLAPHTDLYRLAHKLHRLHLAGHQTQQSRTWGEGETVSHQERTEPEGPVLQTSSCPTAGSCGAPGTPLSAALLCVNSSCSLLKATPGFKAMSTASANPLDMVPRGFTQEIHSRAATLKWYLTATAAYTFRGWEFILTW